MCRLLFASLMMIAGLTVLAAGAFENLPPVPNLGFDVGAQLMRLIEWVPTATGSTTSVSPVTAAHDPTVSGVHDKVRVRPDAPRDRH